MTLEGLYEKIQKLDTVKVGEEAFDKTAGKIVDYQKEQMLQGINAKGTRIGKYKNKAYAKKKNQMNPLPGLGNVDLKLTGSFQSKIKIAVDKDKFRIESGDSKNQMLQQHYSSIFGLSDPFKADYVESDLRPEFQKEMEQATGLKFS